METVSLSLLTIVILCGSVFLLAYRYYGSWLSRILRLDPNATTPAVELRDDLDYMPLETRSLLSQHFSAIAAAGPIVGPILAGVMFGWLPAPPFPLDYILFGLALVALAGMAVSARVWFPAAFLAATGVLVVLDQSRLQPWLIQYGVLAGVLWPAWWQWRRPGDCC